MLVKEEIMMKAFIDLQKALKDILSVTALSLSVLSAWPCKNSSETLQ